MSRFYIVRHGNTFLADETPVRIGARTDPPLTADGERQAVALGTHFARCGIVFDQVLCGPLKRARRTAELIGGSQPSVSTPQIVPWLNEIDHGADEGRPEAAVLARVGAEALRAWDEHAAAPPGWDVDAASRRAAWRRLFARDEGGSILLVTSNGAARFALLECSRRPPGSLKLRTGAFGEIETPSPGTPQVVRWDVRPPEDPPPAR